MGGHCRDSQFWDALLKECIDCVCRKQHVNARCSSFCVSARCKALHAHYYDPLLKKCMNCTEICGRHPAVCSQHCHIVSRVATTQTPRLEVPRHRPSNRVMGGNCRDTEFWDALLKKCTDCQTVCWEKHISARCSSYCVSARCKALHAHYYDPLLKKCMNCTEICGRHPAVCSQHCHIVSPVVTARTPRLGVPPHLSSSGSPLLLESSAVLLYSLLATCMLLLLSSLCLAFAVLLRGKKVKRVNPEPSEKRNRELKSALRQRQEFRFPGIQEGRNAKAFPSSPACHAGYVAAHDSIPTETCVCIHCFPDLKTLSQATDRPMSAKTSHQPSTLQRTYSAGPLWTEGSHVQGPEVQGDPGAG